MATLARQPTDPLHARIAVLIKQGFIVQGNEDGLVLTWRFESADGLRRAEAAAAEEDQDQW